MSKIDVKQIVDVGKVIVDVLDKEAAKTSTDITSDDVSKVAPKLEAEVKKEIAKEVQPVIDHLTNNEAHWWQKRSFWSAIISVLGVILMPLAAKYGLEGYLEPENLETVVDTLTKLAGALAAYMAYRAGTAMKPLGH
jgi:hypothetical protein